MDTITAVQNPSEGRRARVREVYRKLLAFLAVPPTPPFRIAVFVVFAALLVLGMQVHEMWRDEIQAWLIVRDSHSVADLFRNLRYEGHPALWYLLLAPFSLLGREPEWMQVLQGAVALSSVWLILWRGPFTRLEMAMLPFGYFFLFEYGVKSRSYSVGVLLMLLFCASYGLRRRRPEVLGLILGLLANVHVLYGLAAMAAVVAVAFDRWSSPERPLIRVRDAVALGIFGAGLVLSALTEIPPADSGYAVTWNFDLGLNHTYETFQALSSLIAKGGVAQGLSARITTALGLALTLYLLTRWRSAPTAWVFFFGALAGILAFIHVKYGPSPWHHGVLFVVFVSAMWISRFEKGAAGPSLAPRPLFALVLAAQLLPATVAFGRDALLPYSNGKAIARFIKAQGWAGQPVYSLNDYVGSTVLGYLGAASFHYAPAERQGSFVIWDKARLAPVDLDAFLSSAQAAGRATVLDCNRTANDTLLRFGFVEVARFEHSMTWEDCAVYRPAP